VRSLYSFIIKPKNNQRYQNTKKVYDKDLILNTEMQNHEFVNRTGIVLQTPVNGNTGIKQGDEVIVHHNVFRRFYDMSGKERNSKSYFKEDEYFVEEDQIYMYRRNDKWHPLKGYCFVKPILNQDDFNVNTTHSLMGVLKYIDNDLKKNGVKLNNLVGFTPDSEYEFEIDNQIMYRVPTNSICIRYEYQGNEKEYSPSWLQSSGRTHQGS